MTIGSIVSIVVGNNNISNDVIFVHNRHNYTNMLIHFGCGGGCNPKTSPLTTALLVFTINFHPSQKGIYPHKYAFCDAHT